MSYQEKRSLVYLASSILVGLTYYIYVFHVKADQSFNPDVDFKFWGVTFLFIIPVMILINVIMNIVFNVLNVMITKEEGEQFEDEMDKEIEMRANRNAYTLFIFCFMGSVGSLAFGATPNLMFNLLFATVMVGSLTWCLSTIYYYRRGF